MPPHLSVPRWVRWLLVVLWCAFIFHATSSPAYSGDHTQQDVAAVLPTAGAPAVHWLNLAVRKASHLFAFGTLGALAAWALPGASWRTAAAWAFATLYAASDEFHQSFVPGRTAEVWDVFLDSAGALLFILVATAAARRRRVARWERD